MRRMLSYMSSHRAEVLPWVFAVLLTLAGAAAEAATQTAARIVVTSEFETGHATFDILVDENRDLHSVLYTTPTLPQPVYLTLNQILNPPKERAGYGGVIITWKKERPAVILVANADRLEARHGGELTLKYLHNGKDKNNPKFKELPMRVVREGDKWKVLTDDHSTQIRQLCFREKTYWGFTVGAERHEINTACPKT